MIFITAQLYMYGEEGYLQAVEKVADQAINDAVEEVKEGED